MGFRKCERVRVCILRNDTNCVQLLLDIGILRHNRFLVYSVSSREIPTFRHLTRQCPRPSVRLSKPGRVRPSSVVRCSVWSSIELSHVNHLLTEARPSSLSSLRRISSPFKIHTQFGPTLYPKLGTGIKFGSLPRGKFIGTFDWCPSIG